MNGFFESLLQMFSYTFLIRAFIVGILVSLCASLLGVSLVLKRYSMIGDGLSHVGFGALAIATVCNAAPLAVAVPVVVVAAFLLLRLNACSRVGGDAGHCDDFYRRIGYRRYGCLHYNRCEYGYLQLYVRQHSGHGFSGRYRQRNSLRCGADSVCFVLSSAVCRYV